MVFCSLIEKVATVCDSDAHSCHIRILMHATMTMQAQLAKLATTIKSGVSTQV